MSLIKEGNTWHVYRAYRGILPAVLGAIPSSALYFGAYETAKVTLQRSLLVDSKEQDSVRTRLAIHGIAAACGNMISSAVFVPKELIKQQLQYQSTTATNAVGVIVEIVKEKGIAGLYIGYQATLIRNIPSAMLRFVVYEELKRFWAPKQDEGGLPIGLFAAGAVAGALASGIMTPVDVLKTRMATGTCPIGVKNCMLHIIQDVGWKGLYAGGGSRILFSGAFSAIGFGTFEVVKGLLGVSEKKDKR
jgi:solute carrier family 25 S-adenosylmethionine transporter 26